MGLFDFSTSSGAKDSSSKPGGLFNFSTTPEPEKTKSYAGPYAPGYYPPAVDQAVEKVTPSLTDKIGSFFKTLISPLDKAEAGIESFLGTNTQKKSPVLEAKVLEGPSSEDLDKSINELQSSKAKINLQDKKSVDTYNAQVSKIKADIDSFNAAQKAHEVLGKEYIPTPYDSPVKMISHDLSQVLNEPIEMTGEALGESNFFKDWAAGSDTNKFLPSFSEELAKHAQYALGSISGATGGLVQPKYTEDPKDFASKLVSALSQGLGMATTIGGIEGSVFKSVTAPKIISETFENYPKIAEFFNSLAKTVPAFATYGQLNPELNNVSDRLKALGKDIAVSVPFTALGLLSNKGLVVPASAALGFGLAKLGGASNEEAGVAATTLGLLSLMGGKGKESKEIITQRQAKGQLYDEAITTLNKFSDIKISPDSSKEDIKSAFKDAAMKTHPDRGGNSKDFSSVAYAKDVLLGETKTTESTMKDSREESMKDEVRKAAEEVKNPPAPEPSGLKPEIDDIAVNFRRAAPEIKGIDAEQETKLTPEEAQPLANQATDQYWRMSIKPVIDSGGPVIIGGDNLKDFFGKDYNDNNHPVYSQAADRLYERALQETKGDTVIFTGGGPASGKTELVTKALISKGFNGIIYDSNLSNYDGAARQIQMARDAGKKIEIHGIIPNLDATRTFSILRENETGRGISDQTFAHGHSSFPQVVEKLLENNLVNPNEIKIYDTREITTFENAMKMVYNQEYLSNPLETLKSLGYKKEDIKKIYGKENYNATTGQRESPLPGSERASEAFGKNRATQENAVRQRDEGLLGETEKEINNASTRATRQNTRIEQENGRVLRSIQTESSAGQETSMRDSLFDASNRRKGRVGVGTEIIGGNGSILETNEQNYGRFRKNSKGTELAFRGRPEREGISLYDKMERAVSGVYGRVPEWANKLLSGYSTIRQTSNSGTEERTPGFNEQVENILRKEKVPFNNDTPEILRSIGFSDIFISKIDEAYKKGAFKTIVLDSDLEGGDFYGAYSAQGEVIYLNPDTVDDLLMKSGDILKHEISGHAWYKKLSQEGKDSMYSALQSSSELIKESWENSNNPTQKYWLETLNQIKSSIEFQSNKIISDRIMNEFGLVPEQGMSIDSFINQSLSLDKTIEAINKELVRLGKDPINLRPSNTSVIEEHVTMIAENSSDLIAPEEGMLSNYIEDVKNGTLKYGPTAERALIYQGETDLSTTILEKLKGRDTVSKTYISELTNSGDVKQVERDLIRDILAGYPDGAKIPVAQFAKDVKIELLPLKINEYSDTSKYESIVLPDDLRGNVADYKEHIFESPIKTSAGQIHFSDYGARSDEKSFTPENYFGHTRIEDMAPSDFKFGKAKTGEEMAKSQDNFSNGGDTRRVIEVQSDLYQKGNLEKEIDNKSVMELDKNSGLPLYNKRANQVDKLRQYNDPTAHFRMVREEVKQAAKDGKTRLQFPSGETAMKIEGLGDNTSFIFKGRHMVPSDLKIGIEIEDGTDSWIITDVLGEGKFKAVPKNSRLNSLFDSGTIEDYINLDSYKKRLLKKNPGVDEKQLQKMVDARNAEIQRVSETFDISGKVDTNNPIYRFYEKDLGRYLKNKYGAKSVTDDKGVTWYEVDVKPSMATAPVVAFRRGTNDIEQLRKMLERNEQSLEAARSNPQAFARAYGDERLDQLKSKNKELRERITEAKNPSIDTGNRLEDLRQTLVSVQDRVGLKGAPDLQKLKERQVILESMKESIDTNPLKDLEKFEANSGIFKGELPEVTGKSIEEIKYSKLYGTYKDPDVIEFMQKGDQYLTDAGYPDTEKGREAYLQFKDQKEAYKTLLKEQQKETKEYETAEKEENILNKISDKAVKKSEADAMMEKKKKELAIAQAKVNAEYAKVQDKRNKVEKEKEKPIDKRKLNTVNPKSSLDPETQKIYEKFSRQMAEAKVVGLKYANKFPEADKLGSKAYDMYQLVGNAPSQKEIQTILSRIYRHAQTHGFSDLPFRKNYLPQMYKGTHDKVPELEVRKRMATERLEKEGASPEDIKKYLDAMVESGDQSVHLKKNAFFQKYKLFNSYAEAREFGYVPKYEKISELLGVYEKLELETSAARTLIDDLTDAGKIVPEQVAPQDWQPIKYGPHGIKGYWASPKISNFFDGVFRGHENMGLTDTIMSGIAEVSRFGQNIALSGGAPGTSLNFFTAGILNKELLRGNLKAFKEWVRSNSDTATVRSLQADYKYIEMMVRNGISFRSIAGVRKENYESIKTKWGKLKEGVKENPIKPSSYTPFFQIIGDSVDNVFGKKTFDNFMPLLHVQVFRDSYLSLIKKGLPDEEAQIMAAALTKMSQGIMEDVGRSQLTQDKMTALFFAPVYRESIINVLLNTAKSATSKIKDPMYRFNRKLLAGMIIGFALYQLLNQKLNGTYTWQNPQGHEADLRIPLPNGQVGYVPFMPGFLAVPRSIIGFGKGVIDGDFKKAFEQGAQNFSMVLKTTIDVLTNTNYYGDSIYKDTDSRLKKLEKVGKYVGLEFDHPWVKELVNAISDTPPPLYQTFAKAAELPIKFSTEDKEAMSEVYDTIGKQAQARADFSNNAQNEWTRIKAIGKRNVEEGKQELLKLKEKDETFFNKVVDIAKEDKLGLTSVDKAIKQLGVENGERAQYIYNQTLKMKTPNEKKAYVKDLVAKKIVSEDVLKQIADLIRAEK